MTTWAALAVLVAIGACTPASEPSTSGRTRLIYDPETGRLERIEADRDGDGAIDAVAHMDGVHIRFVEVDRNRDGVWDRWEFYGPNPSRLAGPGSPDGRNQIERAEEASGPGQPIVRREFFEDGIISRVEEDTDADGRIDKWEIYRAGTLERVELDLAGRGRPDRRLVYGRGGQVERIEADPDGDGVWTLVSSGGGTPDPAAGGQGSR